MKYANRATLDIARAPYPQRKPDRTPAVYGWAPVPGWPRYEVSIRGEVRNREFARALSPQKQSNGYLHICLSTTPKSRFGLVHRLVWMAHRGPIPEGRVVNHLNGRKADNRLANLECVTRSENAQHALRFGLVRPKKLTAAKAEAVRRAAASGKTQLEVARSFGISQTHVSSIVRGKSWKSLPATGMAR